MTGTPRPVRPTRQQASLARRQDMLDAACRMIFERGYEAVGMSEIGAAAGVTGPAIYRHFASKADMLNVLCNQTIDRLIEFVGPKRESPADELAALVAGQVRLVVRYPELVRVFEDEERALPTDLRRQVRRRERDHAQRWVEALGALRPEASVAELELLAYAAVGLILSVPRWPRAVRQTADMEKMLLAAAWRVIGPLESPAF
jgi:AcrR family transcriptional regulator